MAEPRWLDDDEQRLWRQYLEASSRLMDRLDAELVAGHGLTLGDYEILSSLSESEGRRLRMSELAERALVSRSRLTHRIDRLADRGLVVREACPQDRRGTYAVLTDAGWDAVVAAAPDHVAAVRRYLVDRLGVSTRRSLGRDLDAVLAALAEPAAEPPRR